jgi:2-phospho-L-lactate guanylyltransferase
VTSPPAQYAVLVPVKAFHRAKLRLAPALPAAERAALARRMGAGVLAAAHPLPVAVVCDDPEVAEWARGHGARVIWTPGHGLDGAVRTGVTELAADGFDRVVVAHADLPLVDALAWLAPGDGVTIAPDRWDDGTNVIVVPANSRFRFSYGAGSFRRHVEEGRALGLAVRIVRDPTLGWDVDVPADLELPR